MSFNTDFVDDPEGFLNHHAIVPTEGKLVAGPEGKKIVTGTFSLLESGMSPGGEAEDVLYLRHTPDAADGIDAYWLAYEPNKSKRAMLGNAAGFMFTANMDGCSFGFGSKTGTGERLVGHANAMDVGADAEEEALAAMREAGKEPSDEADVLPTARSTQRDEQHRLLLKKMQPDTLRVLHPHQYADPFHGTSGTSDRTGKILKYAATVVGLRKAGEWKFFCQRRTITVKGQFVLRDVIALN